MSQYLARSARLPFVPPHKRAGGYEYLLDSYCTLTPHLSSLYRYPRRTLLIEHFPFSTSISPIMAAVTRNRTPTAGESIYVLWEVETPENGVQERWYKAQVFQCERSGISNDSILARGTMSYFATEDYADHLTCAVNFLVGNLVSVTRSTVHTDGTPSPWAYHIPDGDEDDESFEPPSHVHSPTLASSERFTTMETELASAKACIEDLTRTVHSLTAHVYRSPPTSTSAELSNVQNLMRVRIVLELQKPTAKFVRKVSRKYPPPTQLQQLSFAGIIRSFVVASFELPFEAFRTFVLSLVNEEKNLPPYKKCALEPPLEAYSLQPMHKKSYYVTLRTFKSFCASFALNQPETRERLLYRSKGTPRALGSFQGGPSNHSDPAFILPGCSLSSNDVLFTLPPALNSNSSPCLKLNDTTVKEDEGTFRNRFEKAFVAHSTIRLPSPTETDYAYNSFHISWGQESFISSQYRSDTSLTNVTLGTVRVSVPTLTFMNPKVARTVAEFMTDDVISTIANGTIL